MVRPYSNDLRKRVVAAVSKGESCRAVALQFGVAVSSVVKWSQRYRSTGSFEPGKMGGHRKSVLYPPSGVHREAAESDAASDAARPEGRIGGARGQGLAQRGLAILAPGGAAVQKKRCSLLNRAVPMSPADGGAGDRGRPAWTATPGLHRRDLDQDQYGTVAGMGAKRRASAASAHGRLRTMMFLGGGDGTTSWDLACSTDQPTANASGLCCASALTVVEAGRHRHHGNLGSNKSAEVRRMTSTVGEGRDPPPYSPDLNPIEQAFAKIKHWMRIAQKRTIEDLWRHIGSLVSTIEAPECSNYFANAGYASIKP